MNDELERFLNSISYEGNREDLQNIEIEKVLFHKDTRLYEVILTSEKVIPYETVSELFLAAQNGIHGKEKCKITMKYQTIEEESVLDYVTHIAKIIKVRKPSLGSILDSVPTMDENNIIYEVSNKTEQEEMENVGSEIESELRLYGLGDYFCDTVFNAENPFWKSAK